MILKKVILITSLLVLGTLYCNGQVSLDPEKLSKETAGNYNNTPGTFQFMFPNNRVVFMDLNKISSLYPDIESRRLNQLVAYWEYTPDITVIIFPRSIINSSDFIPIESPYKGTKSTNDL